MRFLCALAFTLSAGICWAGNPVVDGSLATSVTIRSGLGQGSGTLFTRGDTTYVWTAGHVIEDLRKTRKIIADGVEKTVVEFADAQIVQEFTENGRRVGEVCIDAEVLHYSDADTGHDLAILRVRKSKFTTLTTRFYDSDQPIPVGSELYHVGSLKGQFGANSYTTGVVSSIGRVLKLGANGVVFDQTTVTAFPGSSGGGIYLKETGEYVGMLVRGSGEQFNFIVPIRRMREWARECGIEWALTDEPQPTPAEGIIKGNRYFPAVVPRPDGNRRELLPEDERALNRLFWGDFGSPRPQLWMPPHGSVQ